jgi:catechol 2,3-dioxygenase-like lactoylglutathione lyase family enzyme
MNVKGIVWHGSQTERFDEMVDFVGNVLGLKLAQRQETNVVFETPNGDAFEVFPKPPGGPVFYEHPAVGFLVDDVPAARAELEAKGVQFTGPTMFGRAGENWGTAWCSFRAPDGFVYALVSRPEAHPGGSPRKFHELRVCFAVDDLPTVRKAFGEGMGLPVVDEWTHPTGEQGMLFAVCPASLEFFDRRQVELIDRSEVGRRASGPVTLRVEFDNVEQGAQILAQAGFTREGTARKTPWNQICLRMEAPEPPGLQVTVFELAPEEREARQKARSLLPK